MDPIQQMLARLNPVAGAIQQQIGDSFNISMLSTLATLLNKVETESLMSAQVQEAQSYALYLPVNNNIPGSTIGSADLLQRDKGVGIGEDYDGISNDIPLAEVKFDEEKLAVGAGVIGYQYSIHELAEAARLGIPLDAKKQQAATLACEKHLSNIAWYGSTKTTAKGFVNQTGVDVIPASHTWSTATADEIIADVNVILEAAYSNSEFEAAVSPDTVVMASNLWKILSDRRLHDYTDKTLLEHIKEKNILAQNDRKITWRSSSKFNGQGVGGTDRIVAYRRDPSMIEYRIPQELRFLAGQPEGLMVRFPGHYLYQGLWLKRVDSLRYMDVAIT